MIKNNSFLIRVFGVASLACICMLILRIVFYESLMYAFLAWNLFLAWLPFLAALLLTKESAKGRGAKTLFCIFLFWLLFFPNSPYIITDLVHLKLNSRAPAWFDSLLIVLYAWTGLLLGFSSLFKVHKFLDQRFSKWKTWFVILVVIGMSGYGIYLGRFERWNSWDVLTDPAGLFSNISGHFIHPFKNAGVLITSLLFTVFLLVGYLTTFAMINSGKHE